MLLQPVVVEVDFVEVLVVVVVAKEAAVDADVVGVVGAAEVAVVERTLTRNGSLSPNLDVLYVMAR
jgi:hypothetical protein